MPALFMDYLLLSVFSSVIVSIILKMTPKTQWDIRQVIAGGYVVAATLCGYFLAPNPTRLLQDIPNSAWLVFFALGMLLPSLFLVLAKSVEQVGIVRTDAAQRLSLLVPLLAAFFVFGEVFSWLKGLGLALGFIAIIFIVSKDNATERTRFSWCWPVLVFLGMGLIDILFKQMAVLTQIAFADLLFAVFVLAWVVSCLYLIERWHKKLLRWHWHNLIGALLLGSFNFANILFYIKAHQSLAKEPALVFASMNMGVITLGTLVGVWLFHERLNRLNKIGILCALLAVAALTAARL